MHRRTWQPLAGAVFVTATSLVAAWIVPAPHAQGATLTWNFTQDFSATANPAPDSHGNTGVWSYLQGTAHNPATYSLLPQPVANQCNNHAVDFWNTASGYPAVAHNRGTTTATCATATIPAGQGFVHPSSAGPAIIGWKSPITGTVSITGSVVDDDALCGDGILWSIDKGATILASGGFANGGSQAFSAGTGGSSLASRAVSAGDKLYLLVLPKGSFDCDTTGVNLTITAESTTSSGGAGGAPGGGAGGAGSGAGGGAGGAGG